MKTDIPVVSGSPVPLTHATPGRYVRIVGIDAGRQLHDRLAAMGVRTGTVLEVVSGGMKGPVFIAAGNTRLVLGRGMAEKVFVQDCCATP
jgi:Fe2+ transport system protein FeoA